jgi:hypothetical protein
MTIAEHTAFRSHLAEASRRTHVLLTPVSSNLRDLFICDFLRAHEWNNHKDKSASF